MKTLRYLILGLLMTATIVCRAQITDPGWFVAQTTNINSSGQAVLENDQTNEDGGGGFQGQGLQQPVPPIAEAITPDIQALAGNLQNSWSQIYGYVNANIRYVHYYGSKKGAELTLLEKSGNDFDQCALLVALLRAAGYTNTGYKLGLMDVPYDDPTGQNLDLHHWLGLGFSNTNWLYTSNYVFHLMGRRGYPSPVFSTKDTNTFVFQRVWVVLTNGTSVYNLDPSFKFSQPVTGINLTNAMNFSSNNIMSSSVAGGTDTGNYVTNVNEANLRSTLTAYSTNLLNYVQSNYPNATVQQILGGQQTAAYGAINFSTTSGYWLGPAFSVETRSGILSWTYIPTNLMSGLTITFGGTNWQCWMPQLQGQRLTLTYSNNGVAQLWLDDSNVMQGQVATSPNTNNVVIEINHPFGNWDSTNTDVIRLPSRADNTVTNVYQSTNATYGLIYAFEPDWGWLQQRQKQLDAYRQQGYADSSRQVVSETLNIMGLDWMLQTEGAEQMLAAQDGVLPQYHHRFGRMAQEAGKGYYIDIYMQLSGVVSSYGADTNNIDAEYRHLDLTSYFLSALENGLIEQLQSSNLVASSTVKMLGLANTNGQAVYLASSTNWSAISGSLVGYDTSSLNSKYISQGYYLLIPQNGTNHVAGTGSWSGYGIAARQISGGNYTMTMLIGGGYNGGYISDPFALFPVIFVGSTDDNQPSSVAYSPVFTPTTTIADPVDAVDGTFQVEHTDLSLGGAEPRGIALSRYYNGTRRYMNPANMAPGWINNYYVTADAVPAPQAGLGGTTPAQAAAMMAATCAAIGVYNDQPDPKNWLVTALISKWGVDQLTKNAVSVNLGKDLIQFIRQPDGSYTPPPNCTMTLTQSGGAYTLQMRHGNTFKFNAAGMLTNIVDQYNQSLNVAYDSSNRVHTVTDWTNRVFTFSYTNNQLTAVSDGTRAVYYGYTSNDLTSVTDPEGKTTTYRYDTNHEITATIDANTQLVVSNIYDGLGHVALQLTQGDTNKLWQILWTGAQTTEIDPAGGTSTYFYDNLSRLIGMQDSLGHLTQTFYDGQNHVVETKSPLSETNQYIYDGNNNLIETIDPLNSTNQYIYDANNNLVHSVDARGNTNSFGYNAQFSLTGQTNGAGDYVNYSYNGNGTLHTRADSGGTNTYGYDGYGQLNSITYPGSLGGESFVNNSFGDVTSHTDGNGNTTSYTYNKRRQLLTTTAPTNLITSLGYDAVGNLLTSTNANHNVSSYSWSPTRKMLATTLPAVPAGTPVVTNIYDNRDWLAKTLDPLFNPVQFTNDLAGRLIAASDPLSRTNRMGYDADGRITGTTNAASEKTLQQWNKRGQLIVTTDNSNHTVKRGYDAAGNQITLTNRNSKVWQFQYDAANRLTNTISPLTNVTSQTWNHQGLLASFKEPSGHTTTYGYDGLGHLTTRTDLVAVTTYKYDANGNSTNVAESGNNNSWTYDAYNRISTYKDIYGNLIQYRYDANGNMTNLVYPGNRNVYYAYDSNNHMTNVTDWANRKTFITYDLAGRLTSITRPNGTLRTVNYDADGEATNIIEEAASKYPIVFFTLGWTNSGRVAWEFAAPLPHTNAPPSRTMTYNADNQLATFKQGSGNTLTVGSDADGNLTNAPLNTNALAAYVYDARNRLLNVGGVTNAYDAMNNRIGQLQGTNSTVFVVNPNAKLPQVLMRIKNGVTNYYIYGAGLLYQITETATATNTLTYHYDYRGSTVALTDDGGNITDRIEYSLYATTTFRAGTNDTPFLFNGRYGVMTDGNGLLYMRARYYNPYLCRFVNPDPSGFKGGLNFYAYAGGNPVSYLDPFGLSKEATGDNFFSWVGNATLGLLATGIASLDEFTDETPPPEHSGLYELSEPSTASLLLGLGGLLVGNPELGAVGDTASGTLGSRVADVYQQAYNEAWQNTVQDFTAGNIEMSPGQNVMTVLGQQTDAAARDTLRLWVNEQGLSDEVLINQRLYDPLGSGAYRIPDVQVPSENLILDGTIGTKTFSTPQVQDFLNWSGGNVQIINPTITPVP